jgi:hypothetical protein
MKVYSEEIQQKAEAIRLAENEIRRLHRTNAPAISLSIVVDNIVERKAPSIPRDCLIESAADELHRRWGGKIRGVPVRLSEDWNPLHYTKEHEALCVRWGGRYDKAGE